MKTYDSVVVGAGPAGITAALYLSRFGLKTALVEKLAPGGQLLNTFEITNYLGSPQGMEGWKLAGLFSQHLEGYDVERFAQDVVGLTYREGMHAVELASEVIAAKSVIVCSGAAPRKLNLPGEDRLTGRGVSYCAMCDGMFFRGKTVAMVGGGNSALEEALHLSNLVERLYLIHRRDQFRADKVYRDKLAEAKNVIPVVNSNIVELRGEETLAGVAVESVVDGTTSVLDVAGLFVFIGVEPAGAFLPPDLEMDPQGFVLTDQEMRTNVPGLFAAGDIRAKQCRQVVTAVGDGATAAYSAFEYVERLGCRVHGVR